MSDQDQEPIEHVETFGKAVSTRFRIKEIKDEYQAENKYVLDFSETEFVSRAVADELVSCNIPMRLSEPVKRMMEVVASE